MGLKDTVDKAIDNVKDATNEAVHNGTADAEQAKRDVAGDALTPEERLDSMANQAKNRAQATIDSAKQKVRNNT
jgi:hypothetical protein